MKREDATEQSTPAESNFLWISGSKVTREAQSHSSRVAARRRRLQAANKQDRASKAATRSFRSNFSPYERPLQVRIAKKDPDEEPKASQAESSSSSDEDLETIPPPDPKTLLTASREDPFDSLAVAEPNIGLYVNRCEFVVTTLWISTDFPQSWKSTIGSLD